MMAEQPDRCPKDYSGPLAPEAVAKGINAANRNAQRLAADARILLDAERFPSAAAVAALAIEESGKTSILRGLALAKSRDKLRSEWRRYRDHRSKNGAWIMPALVAQGGRQLGDFRDVVERDGEHTALLNSIKQIALYADCYGDAHWSEPGEVVDRELARSLVAIAEILCARKQVTHREIELWVEHLGPVWETPEMPAALLRWASAMYREGLTDSPPETFARFVFGEVGAGEWKNDDQKSQ
jgi:AbiV family abortive infection protein